MRGRLFAGKLFAGNLFSTTSFTIPDAIVAPYATGIRSRSTYVDLRALPMKPDGRSDDEEVLLILANVIAAGLLN